MTWIINTPSHKRWVLPCGCHLYNSVLSGDRFYVSILDRRTEETVTSHQIAIKEGWENLSHLSQELANKNHPYRVGRLGNCKIPPRR